MKSLLVTSILALSLLIAPATFAQSDPDLQDEPAPVEIAPYAPVAPANVQPAGLGPESPDIGIDAIRAIPSPLGPALPGAVLIETNSLYAHGSLLIDGRRQLYSYDCAPARCRGFATQLWRILPGDQRRAYLDAVMDALIGAYPGYPSYVADIQGNDATGPIAGRVQTWPGPDRTYDFFLPPL